MTTTITVTLNAHDSVRGFNNRGEIFSAARNAGNRYNCGEGGRTAYDTRTTEVATLGDAVDWVVRQLVAEHS